MKWKGGDRGGANLRDRRDDSGVNPNAHNALANASTFQTQAREREETRRKERMQRTIDEINAEGDTWRRQDQRFDRRNRRQ